jgi:hypothetical protein
MHSYPLFLSIISMNIFMKFVQLTIDGSDLAKFETKRPLLVEFGIVQRHLQSSFGKFESAAHNSRL